MKRGIAWAVFTGLFVCAVGRAQDPITIKLKERGEGETGLVKRNEKTMSKVTVTDGMGQILVDQKQNATEIIEYTETILKRQAGKSPTKLMRAYAKAQSGKDDKVPEDSPLQGKTVVIEKTEGTYVFTYKNGDSVRGQAAAALVKDFSKKSDANAELEKLVLPSRAVKPGANWNIDMPKIVMELAKQGGMELDAAKSSGQGTLVKAYKKGGAQFGEMKFKMEMPIVTIGKDKEQLKFAAGAKIVLDLTMDVCIDGSSENGSLKMKMLMTGDATVAAAPGATATLNVSVDAVQVQQDVKK